MTNKRTLIAAIMMVAIIFVSCGDMFIDKEGMTHFNDNQASGMSRGERPANDTLVGFSYKDVREVFIGNAVEYSFIHVDLYKEAGAYPEKTRRSIIVELTHEGVAPQYFHYSDTAFATEMAESSVKDSVIDGGEWKVKKLLTTRYFVATNASNDTICTSTTTGAAEVVYVFEGNDSLNLKGYEVVFDAPTYTLSEGTTMGYVTGLPYDGKTWAAAKYDSKVAAQFEIASDYRISEEPAVMNVNNLAFLLKHEVNTSLEDVKYVGKFNTVGRFLTTEEERVYGSLVTRDNGESTEATAFDLSMILGLELSEVQDIEVASEEALSDIAFDTVSTVVANSEDQGVFTKVSVAGVDSIAMSDGRKVGAAFGYTSYLWGEEVLPYAKIAGRKVEVTSVENNDLTTAALKVNTVTVKVTADIAFVGIIREAETYMVQTSYNRFYNVPNDSTLEVIQRGYELNLHQNGASALYADEYNTIQEIWKNRGELVSSISKNLPLNLWAKAETKKDTVVVAEAFTPQVTGIIEHADKGGVVENADTTNGRSVRYVQDSQSILVKGGQTIEYEWYYEKQYLNGSVVYDYATVENNPGISFAEPVLVDSFLNGNQIEKIYRIDASILPTITSTKAAQKAATRAASSNNVNTISLTTPLYQKVIVNDTYVDGSDRIDTIVTVNGNIATITVNLYETFTISGERLVDSKSQTVVVKLQGSDGGEVVASDSIVVTNGLGLTGCGEGTYTNNVTGAATWTNSFTYSAPAAEPIVLNGANGTVTVNVPTSWVITENGQTVGAKVAVAGYDKYNYVSSVKGTCKVGNETIEVTAEATKTIKVARNVQNVTGRTITWCSFSVVPAVKNETTGTYSYTTGKHNPVPCMVIGFADGGAEAVLFENKPTIADVQNAYYSAGNYTDIYNGAVLLNGNWVPAIARDETWGINYSLTGSDSYFPVGTESLSSWGWSSTVLTGYTSSVENGVLTVFKGTEMVLEIK